MLGTPVEAMALRHKVVIITTVLGSIPIRGNELLFTNIFFFSLWLKSRKLDVESHNSIHIALKNLAESRERSVLTLSSLCLHCLMRDTA